MSIPVSIFWHQHQPYYKDLTTNEMVMPWVRLHGIKDYYGMAKLISEFPGVKCAINLVPSLVAQLIDYTDHNATDPFLRHTQIAAEDLDHDQACFVLDKFFMAQWDRMVRCYPRYRELLDKRGLGRRPASRALVDFSTRDLLDLQVWYTLTWFHPVCFDEFEVLRTLREKGRDFTEEDKKELLLVEKEVLRRVIPLHAELVRRGQLELTTTPFYHPIMPLLCDMKSANQAMPRNPMPHGHYSLTDDCEAQVAKAMAFHEKVFGVKPTGMWPSEGSVSPDIIPILSKYGIEWIATDEEILSASISTGLRGGWGRVERPDLLYRPWKIETRGKDGALTGSLSAVFRDHQLSDLVGFQYAGWDGEAAASDFLTRIEGSTRGHPAGEETLVSVILDGENCWEHYHEQGTKFLRNLYARLQDGSKGLRTEKVGDFIKQRPPSRVIDKVFSGSWINHDFYIWIGHNEDRKAWEYVFRVREDLLRETERRGFKAGVTQEEDANLGLAWEELYVAEGSDWYWWYGDDHSSGMDDLFDLLFRTHLKNVYKFLDLKPPYFLDEPVKSLAPAQRFVPPSASMRINIDGRLTSYFEWMGAGIYKPDKEGGVMTASTLPLVAQIMFGYDRDNLYTRVDFLDSQKNGPDAAPEETPTKVVLYFVDPAGPVLEIHKGPPVVVRKTGEWPTVFDGTQGVWDEILEIVVPFGTIKAERGKELLYYVEVHNAGGGVERFPKGVPLQFTVPPLDIEEREWMV